MRILLILILIMIPIASATIEECEPITSSMNIPCYQTNNWIPSAACNTYTYKIFNASGDLLQDGATLSAMPGTGFCRTEFNETQLGTYYTNFTTGDTFVLEVQVDNMAGTYLIGIGVLFIGFMAFLIYLSNQVPDQLNGLKWFLRLFAFFLAFPMFIGSYIIMADSPWEGLENIFPAEVIPWIFFLLLAIFCLAVLVKLYHMWLGKKQEDFERGLL